MILPLWQPCLICKCVMTSSLLPQVIELYKLTHRSSAHLQKQSQTNKHTFNIEFKWHRFKDVIVFCPFAFSRENIKFYQSHTLFCWMRWKLLPYVLRPLSKLRHSSSDQRLISSIGGAICIRCRRSASSTLWPHCNKINNACKWKIRD